MRRYRLRQDRLPKGMAYPLRRCSLDAVFEVGDVGVVRDVSFHVWPGRPHFEALFFGAARRSPAAGTCVVHINAVSRRELKDTESVLLVEAVPLFLRWLAATRRLAVSRPRDIFRWNAWVVDRKLMIADG